MAFFKIDTEKAETQASRLNEYGTFVASERSNIYKSSENNSHPVGTVEEAARAYGAVPGASGGTSGPSSPDGSSTQPDALGGDGSSTTLAGCASAIVGLAIELNVRTTEVINLNSNGVNNMNSDGTYSYYLPDPPEGTVDEAAYWASMDTASNVRVYNSESAANGKKQAQEFQAAINSGDQARVSQLLDEIDKHRDVPAYGATFYKQCGGASEYLALVHNAEQTLGVDPNAVLHVTDTLGHILGGASQSAVGGDNLGKEFAGDIKGSPTGDNIAAFNALVSVPGSSYGTAFLVDAATVLEDVDSSKISPGTGLLSLEFSRDPMAGVLAAMGNNSKAALTYLGGNGSLAGPPQHNWTPDEVTQKRWEKLTSRDWKNYGSASGSKSWCKTGQDGFTAALAALSTYRNSDNPESDARATYASGKGVHYFAGDQWSKDDFTSSMQGNMAVVLSNSPEEVVGAATSEGIENEGQGPSLITWGVTEQNISTLIYRFGNNKDALTTLAVGGGKYNHNKIEEQIAGKGEANESLQNQYQNAAATAAYIEKLSNLRVEDDFAGSQASQAERIAKQRGTVATAVNVANTIAATGIAASSAGPAGASVVYSLVSAAGQPYVADQVATQLGIPENAGSVAGPQQKYDGELYYERLKDQGFADVANNGLFVQPDSSASESEKADYTDYRTQRDHPNWYAVDPQGNRVMNVTSLSDEDIKKVMSWKSSQVSNQHDLEYLNNVDVGVETGVSEGRRHAESTFAPTRK